MSEIDNAIFNSAPAIANKLLQEDGTITDFAGNSVINATDTYKSKPAIPNKILNPDGSYSKLSDIIGGASVDLFIVVEELPDSGDPNKIYLLIDGDELLEYHWTGSKWDPIGTLDIDITNYSTTEEMNAAIQNYVTSNTLTKTNTTSYTPTANYHPATKKYVDDNAVSFKPFPNTFNTTGTTLQFLNSIASQNLSAGMVYLGQVSLSDVPEGVSVQAEVEVYIYPQNVVYCMMRSAEVSPYIWECNSYEYRGWEAIDTTAKEYTDTVITQQANRINELQAQEDLLMNQIPVNSSQGIEIDLDDSSDLPFKEFNILGNSIQKNYNGENLFDKNTMGRINRYINTELDKWQTSADSYSVAIPCEPNRSYTISHSVTTATIFRCAYIKVTTIPSSGEVTCYNVYRGTTDISYTITTGENATYLIFQGNASAMSDIINSLEVVGNFVEPSPSYPETIYSTGDNGNIIEKIINVNYFDGELTRGSITSGSSIRLRSTNQIDVVPNEEFTISLSTTSAFNVQGIVYEYDGNDERTQLTSDWNRIPYTFTTSAATKKIRFVLRKSNDGTFTADEVSNVQLQKGSIVLPYQARLQQNITIPCQQPMRKIGEIGDYFFKNTSDSLYYDNTLVENAWYERHCIKRLVLNGTEGWLYDGSHSRYYCTLSEQDKPSSSDKTALCDRLINASTQTTDNSFALSNTQLFIRGIDNLSSYLSTQYSDNTPVYIDYIANSATNLICTQAQIAILETLRDLHTYRNITHIYSNDATPANIDIVYRQDLTTLYNEYSEEAIEANITSVLEGDY